MQGKTNRQVGDKEVQLTSYQASYVERAEKSCLVAYEFLIDSGIARECARMVLPLSTQTTLYMSGSCRSFIHYLQLRTKEDTQKEHREVALNMQKIFCEAFPTIAKALEWR
jgi:thymidylate synthase (FAD)